MKNILMAGFAIFSIIIGSIMPFKDIHQSKESKLAHNLLNKTSKFLSKKYELFSVGDGVSMPDGIIKELTLVFDSRKAYSKNQLRKILLESSNEILKQINSNEELKKNLIVHPFTEKNIEIVVFNHNINGTELYDPNISVSELSEGFLKYRTNDPNNPYKYKNEFKEAYEDALKLIQDK